MYPGSFQYNLNNGVFQEVLIRVIGIHGTAVSLLLRDTRFAHMLFYRKILSDLEVAQNEMAFNKQYG